MDTEWLFGMFPSIGRLTGNSARSSSFTFEESTLLASCALSVATDVALVTNVSFVTDEPSEGVFPATTAGESPCVVVSANSSH